MTLRIESTAPRPSCARWPPPLAGGCQATGSAALAGEKKALIGAECARIRIARSVRACFRKLEACHLLRFVVVRSGSLMRRVELRGWPVLTLALAACSALLDFDPVPKEQNHGAAEGREAGVEGGVVPGLDGQVPFADAAVEAGASCELSTHQGCDVDQLCCDRSNGAGASCVDTLGARECQTCGEPCSNPAAPHCGAGRMCECERGSGRACPAGERCLAAGAEPRCAECETDDDCGTREGRKQCVANRCVQCDRGALSNDATDDQGCNEAGKPICNATNECVACSSNPDDCPGDQTCNGTLGCFGCNLLTPLDTRNCGGTKPICRRTSSGQPQCEACLNNNECGSGYCDSRPSVGTGACTSACAPAAVLGMNGCSAPTPFCKQIAGSEFACRACVAADCSGTTPYCATEPGSRRGYCVTCRNNADCGSTPSTPVCDATAGTCRARQASDCAGGSVFDPASMTCIDCVADADCADTPATPVCIRNACVQCNVDAQCSTAAAPLCSPTTNRCVACNMLGTASADAQCAVKEPGTICVTRGNRSGRCAPCEPNNNRGCSAPTPFCFARNNNSALLCHECDPNDNRTTCVGGNCRLVGDTFRCAVPDAGAAVDATPPSG